MNYSLKDKSVVVFGASGMVGSALVRRLKQEGCSVIYQPTHKEWDLTNQVTVNVWFESHKPDVVFMPAALVGGIQFNIDNQERMLWENTVMSFNVIQSAVLHKTERLIYFGSSCQYPATCAQPMREEYIGDGHLEPTNKGYAVAKNAACDLISFYNKKGLDFVSLIPCNLYGPGDNSGPNGHVLAMLMEKHRTDNEVVIWGDGTARREFLHVDDLADAAVLICEQYNSSVPINVGVGIDVTIKELAKLIGKVYGNHYTYKYDTSKPNGMKQKLLNSVKLYDLGWTPKISLEYGIKGLIHD